jgi:ribonuclease Z
MIPKMPPREGQLGYLYFPPYRLQGISVAGEQTTIQVPELDLNFDMGHCTRASLTAKTVALSHAHMDHLGALPYWLSQRYFQKLGIGRVVCHPKIAGDLAKMLKSWHSLEGQSTPCEIIELTEGNELPLKGNFYLRCVEMNHTSPCQGYVVIEKRSKLKAEYRELPQDRIKDLKTDGVEITELIELPIIAYTGDTNKCDALKCDLFRKARTMITECTFFLEEHKERAKIGKHLHVTDLVELLNVWEAGNVVITHVSRRTSLGFAHKILKELSDGQHVERTHFLMDFKSNKKRFEGQLEAVGTRVNS